MLRFVHVLAFAPALSVAVAQTLVVPAGHATGDGNSRFWIGGTIQARRQLTLVGGSWLGPLVNHSITGLTFRRNAEDKPFGGGDATLTVRMSHSPRTPTTPSAFFALDHGSDLTTVFQGTVQLPASPSTGSSTTVAWSPANVLSITLQTPFTYSGGTLAIEVTGTPGAAPASWWPADAVWARAPGIAVSVGQGSGNYGGPSHSWSLLDQTNLIPSGTATFTAVGTPNDLAVLAIAPGTFVQRFDLSTLGVPGTFAHVLDPFAVQLALFGQALTAQQPSIGGYATYQAPIPADPAFLGASFGSQWFAVDPQGRIAASNAHQWTVSSQLPTNDLALVSAAADGAEPSIGRVVPGLAHVMKLDYQ